MCGPIWLCEMSSGFFNWFFHWNKICWLWLYYSQYIMLLMRILNPKSFLRDFRKFSSIVFWNGSTTPRSTNRGFWKLLTLLISVFPQFKCKDFDVSIVCLWRMVTKLRIIVTKRCTISSTYFKMIHRITLSATLQYTFKLRSYWVIAVALINGYNWFVLHYSHTATPNNQGQ